MTNRNSSSINVPEARDAMDKFKSAQKKSEITEDELHDGEDKMQKLTDKYVKEVDAMVAKKSKELAEV